MATATRKRPGADNPKELAALLMDLLNLGEQVQQVAARVAADPHAAERAHCATDAAYFINAYCKVESDRGEGVIPFHLYDYQREALEAWEAHLECIYLKARQLGITELAAAYAVWYVNFRSHIKVIVFSQDEPKAKEFCRKCRIAWEHLPTWLRAPILDPHKITTLELQNGSRILPQAATENSARSLNCQLLILDEWAHQQYGKAIFEAAAPTARSAGNKILVISTAKGAGNAFHVQWELAEAGQGMHPLFTPWDARPGRDAAWYANATKGYDEAKKAQEYPKIPEEAFILSGRPVFDVRAIGEILQVAQEPIADDHNGALRIWEQPTQMGQYVIGADVAEGLLKGDYSAAVVVDVHSGREVACLHGHWPPAVFAQHLNTLGRRYNNAHLGVERNNHGHAVLLALVELHQYPALYWHRDYDATGTVERAGWPTSSKTKPIMIDALAATFRERRPWRNRHMLAEARTYTYDDNGGMGASGDLHDDLVVAYAIAEMVRTYRPTQTYVEHEIETLGLADFAVETRY